MEINQHLEDWLLALESDEYEQCHDFMRVVDPNGDKSYCCLGVAAELAGCQFENAEGNSTPDGDGQGVIIDGQPELAKLPPWLAQLLGINQGFFEDLGGSEISALVNMNDTHGFSFKEIATTVRYSREHEEHMLKVLEQLKELRGADTE